MPTSQRVNVKPPYHLGLPLTSYRIRILSLSFRSISSQANGNHNLRLDLETHTICSPRTLKPDLDRRPRCRLSNGHVHRLHRDLLHATETPERANQRGDKSGRDPEGIPRPGARQRLCALASPTREAAITFRKHASGGGTEYGDLRDGCRRAGWQRAEYADGGEDEGGRLACEPAGTDAVVAAASAVCGC